MDVLQRYLEEIHDEEGHDEHHDEELEGGKPWGKVIAAAFIVQLITFSGILCTALLSMYGRLRSNKAGAGLFSKIHQIVIPSFGAGAILATVVFLVVPEALILLGGGHGAHGEEEHDDHDEEEGASIRFFRFLAEHEESHEEDNETAAAWKFGSAFLGGLFFLVVLHALVGAPEDTEDCEVCVEELGAASTQALKTIEESEDKINVTESGERESVNQTMEEGCDNGDCCHDHKHEEAHAAPVVRNSSKTINWPLITSIIIGDGFHNFADGVFLGTAFLLCNDDLAFTLVATTVYHELAQEISDHALLTHFGGLSPMVAAFLNFASGFSIWLGAILTLSLDLSDVSIGTILAFSAGVYVYIGACECIPRIQESKKSLKDTLIFASCFVLGAVPIGLVLLNHSHCEAGHDKHEEH